MGEHSHQGSSTSSHAAELLRLLAPKVRASEADQRLRATALLQHAAREPQLGGTCGETAMRSLDPETADRLRAFQILQGVLRSSGQTNTPQPALAAGAPHMDVAEVRPAPQPEKRSVETCCLEHELSVRFDALPAPVRLLEALDSEEATQTYKSAGEEDPFGSKVWPTAYLAAQRLLSEGVCGRSVLELGCGTGLVSIAAALGGAQCVLATDCSQANVDRALRSARLNGVELCGEVFDVTSSCPLPSRDFAQSPAACGLQLPSIFDFVVFSDVLYWPKVAAAFGRRAGEAYAAGSTVIAVDPGRRRDDFLAAVRDELKRQGVGPWPDLEPRAVVCPGHVRDWVSAEVQTASSLFCDSPFELVLQGPRPGTRWLRSAHLAPAHFELVD